MEQVIEQINSLNREQVIEAATFVSNIITDGAEDPEAVQLTSPVKESPFQYISDIESLARIILINAADKKEYKDLVQQAIDNSGQKNLILGGTEIVALAVVGLAALKIIVNPKTEETEIKNSDGKTVKVTKYGGSDTGFLDSLFKFFFK